jgi:hypothetical protein
MPKLNTIVPRLVHVINALFQKEKAKLLLILLQTTFDMCLNNVHGKLHIFFEETVRLIKTSEEGEEGWTSAPSGHTDKFQHFFYFIGFKSINFNSSFPSFQQFLKDGKSPLVFIRSWPVLEESSDFS